MRCLKNKIHKFFSHRLVMVFAMIFLSFACILISVCFKSQKITKNDYEAKDKGNFQISGKVLGSYVNITIYNHKDNFKNGITDKKKIDELLDKCMEKCGQYELILDKNNKDSQLYKLNSNSGFLSSVQVEISEELYEIISESLAYSAYFGEKYKINTGNLIALWDIDNGIVADKYQITGELISSKCYDLILGYRKIVQQFNEDKYERELSLYGYKNSDENISAFDINTATRRPSINLDASAQGYICGKLAEFLYDSGIRQCMVTVGRNVTVIGDKGDKTGINIGIKRPFSKEDETSAVVKLRDASISTLSVSDKYFKKDGKIYHNIIDASTGYPGNTDIYSVTIICEDAVQADCYSYGCILLGKDAAINLVNSINGIECVIIDNNYNIITSDGIHYDKNKKYLVRDTDSKYFK